MATAQKQKSAAPKVREVHSVPKFGDKGTGDVKSLQQALAAAGAKLKIDDHFGAGTLKALQNFQKANGLVGTGAIPADGGKTFALLGLSLVPVKEEEVITAPTELGVYFRAPWIGANIDLLGRHETDSLLQARYVPHWKVCGLPGYKTLSGNSYAWCSIKVDADLTKVGITGTKSAGASSWTKYGEACDFMFGCILPIKHKSGGRHVGFFLYWVDEAKKIAAVYGGNQGNKLSIVATNLAGKGDVLVGGPRWPKGVKKGSLYSKKEVLAAYPLLKVGGVAGSTR